MGDVEVHTMLHTGCTKVRVISLENRLTFVTRCLSHMELCWLCDLLDRLHKPPDIRQHLPFPPLLILPNHLLDILIPLPPPLFIKRDRG
jgi:hypothetical protein